jgi:hypothetical protein
MAVLSLSWLLGHQLAKLVELVAKPYGDLFQPLRYLGIASPAHDGLDIADKILGLFQKAPPKLAVEGWPAWLLHLT